MIIHKFLISRKQLAKIKTIACSHQTKYRLKWASSVLSDSVLRHCTPWTLDRKPINGTFYDCLRRRWPHRFDSTVFGTRTHVRTRPSNTSNWKPVCAIYRSKVQPLRRYAIHRYFLGQLYSVSHSGIVYSIILYMGKSIYAQETKT